MLSLGQVIGMDLREDSQHLTSPSSARLKQSPVSTHGT